MRITNIVAIAVFCFLHATRPWADTVTPNDRVSSGLNVRAEATASSSLVGRLEVGQHADLVGQIPYWYNVQLSDGSLGWVSKGYSHVVTELSQAQVLRLGSWNILKLGWENGKDYELVAEVIEENYDLVGIVEVMQKSGSLHPGYDTLLAQLGNAWKGFITEDPRPDTSSQHSEFYGVLFRESKVQPCAQWNNLRYFPDGDGAPESDLDDRFSREPAIGCFVSGNFDFLFATYHATWSDGDLNEIAAEVSNIHQVLEFMSESKPGEMDLLISGDFNLVPVDLAEAIGREIPTAGEGSTLNRQGERTGNLYDHLLVANSQSTTELIGSAEVVDPRNKAASNKLFYKSVSDHLPIVARFDIASADDDP